MNPQFWHNRQVFITGHTGFKGSWLCLWLQSLGARLTGYALSPPTNPSLFQEADVATGMKSIIGDIRNLETLQQAMQEAKPEIVLHLAAQPLVRHSYQHPVETYSTNVMGTVNVLEAVRTIPGIRAVVNVTTDKCYENREWHWGYRENEAMGGHDPYSSSKGCAELVSAAYRASYFSHERQPHIALATARAGNVIGGGDWAKDRLIPDIMAAFEQNQTVSIRHPHAIRPWQHVLEPLRGYLMLAERLYEQGPDFAEGWNFGPSLEDAQPVAAIVETISALWGHAANWQSDQGQHVHEAGSLCLDISKARSRLNWQPALNLNDALNLVVDWSRQRHAGADPKTLTLNQIKAYQTLTEKKFTP